jgi:hypothetical protein
MAINKNDIKNQTGADVITKHKDNSFTAKWSYYYRHGQDETYYEKRISNIYANVSIIESGDHFHYFVGDAKPGSAQDSYIWVKFKFN